MFAQYHGVAENRLNRVGIIRHHHIMASFIVTQPTGPAGDQVNSVVLSNAGQRFVWGTGGTDFGSPIEIDVTTLNTRCNTLDAGAADFGSLNYENNQSQNRNTSGPGDLLSVSLSSTGSGTGIAVDLVVTPLLVD